VLYSTTNNNNITLYGEDCLFVKAPSQGFIKILGRKASLPKALFMHWWLFNLQRKSWLRSYLIIRHKDLKILIHVEAADITLEKVSNFQTECLVFFNTPRAWNLIGRPTRGWKWEENWTEKKLLDSNKFWRKNLNLIQRALHNPPDSSILISCRNDSNILYNQHQFQKNTKFSGDDFAVVPGHM